MSAQQAPAEQQTAPSNDGDTGTGFIEGVEPAQPRNAAEWGQVETAVSQSQQPPIQITDPQPPEEQGQHQLSEAERALVEQARREEKDKLYGRMESMQEQLQRLTQEREEREREEQEAIAAAEAERKAKEEEEMELRDLLESREKSLREELDTLKNEREADRAIFEKERRLLELDQYRQARIEQEAEYIMPQLRDLISGEDEAAIDSAIEDAKQRTSAILDDVRASVPAPQTQRGVASTAPPVGPMENVSEMQSLSPEDIRTMDMDTYRKHRDQLVQAASTAYRRGG